MQLSERAAIPCNLCGETEVTVLSRRSRSGRPLRTVACVNCGLAWSDPRPHDARRFYEQEYRVEYKRTFTPKPKHVLRAGRVALARLQKIAAYVRPGLRALDVGSGGGEFAYLLRSRGCTVTGVEPNRGYAEFARREFGLEIVRGFIDEVTLPPASFDLITIWHVLEHTEDPGAVLAHLRAALKPEGVLVVEVPNVEATCQAPRSTFHEAHLYSFNGACLQALAQKAGLRTIDLSLSSDGGNILAIFCPAAASAQRSRWALPGNHARVTGVVQAHARRPYWLTSHPYRRAAGRLRRTVAERLALLGAPTARALLDRLYRQAESDPMRLRLLWPSLAGLYALAIVVEEVFVDNLLPAHGFSEQQALLLFFVLQAASLAAVLWQAERTAAPGPQRAAAFAAALPAFAVPAYC